MNEDEDRVITREERHRKIVEQIVDFSEIFETFASNGRPIFSDSIPTACICFNVEGTPIGFVWGKDFFDSCSDYKAKFILCHEMLHIFLKHGVRMEGLKNKNKANVTMDISINHLLVDEFGFVRGLIEGWEDLCWRDTVFNTHIPALPAFESYYELDDSFFNKGFSSLDEHKFLKGGGEGGENELSEELQKVLDELRKKMARGLPSHGDETGYVQKEFKVERIKKPKFDTLVKKITASVIELKKKETSSWTRLDRRMCEIAPDLPSIDTLHERRCRKRYRCAFFVDNSGSCSEYVERFCKAAESLNPKVFEVDAYTFDTSVHKINKLNGRYSVTGGGGTCFKCIGKKVEETNPDIVFVVTDGFAGSFIPKDRKKFFWFLTEDGSENAIRGAGKIYRLSQYE